MIIIFFLVFSVYDVSDKFTLRMLAKVLNFHLSFARSESIKGTGKLHVLLVVYGIFLSFRFHDLQAVATLGTYDIALDLGKKVICQRSA